MHVVLKHLLTYRKL